MRSERADADLAARPACGRGDAPAAGRSFVRSAGPAPRVMLSRVCGPLNSLLACGVARHAEKGVVDLFLSVKEAAQGGMAMISMWVPVRKAEGVIDELFSAWLAVPSGVAEGAIVSPSVLLPGMIQPMRFRIQINPIPRESNQAPEPTR